MAEVKYIDGKKDACRHDGLYAIRLREQAAEYHLAHWQEEISPEKPRLQILTIIGNTESLLTPHLHPRSKR